MREIIERLFAAGAAADRDEARTVFAELRRALGAGEVRAAEPDAAEPTGWRVNAWVKQGILLGFRHGDTIALKDPSTQQVLLAGLVEVTAGTAEVPPAISKVKA